GREQEAQFGLHPHLAGQQLDAPVDAGAAQGQAVALPAAAQAMPLLQPGGDALHRLADLLGRARMGVFDIDAGQASDSVGCGKGARAHAELAAGASALIVCHACKNTHCTCTSATASNPTIRWPRGCCAWSARPTAPSAWARRPARCWRSSAWTGAGCGCRWPTARAASTSTAARCGAWP